MFKFYLILALISTLFIYSCKQTPERRESKIQPPTQESVSTPPKMKRAYIFSAEDIYGNSFSLSAFQGKVILLNFFATWCPPCRIEIPHLTQLNDELAFEDFILVGISMDRASTDVIREFTKRFNIRYPVIMAQNDIIDNYGFDGTIPTTVLIDKDFNIVKVFKGMQNKIDLKNEIQKILGE